MKTIIKITFLLMFLQISTQAFCTGDPEKDTLNAPKKVLILTQSYEPRGITFTVIDLDNNEMVIMFYGTGNYAYGDISNFKLRKVLRTGMIIDPEQQTKINIGYSVDEKKE